MRGSDPGSKFLCISLGEIEQSNLRRRSSWWPLGTAVGDSLLFKVFKNLGNDCRVFYAGNDLDWTFALLTDFDIDIEYPFQSLHPCHRGMAFRWGLLILGLILGCFLSLA